MKNKIKIIASGGGTISHTIPLVEVLKQLDKNVFEILYIISNEGPEFEIIKNEFSYKKIYVGKIYRNIDLRNIINIFKNLVGIVQAKIIFLSFKPDLVICKGGYVTIPIIFWSIIFNKKLIIHESDSVLGFANKFASKYAKKILTAFDKKYYPKELAKKIEVCGIPLRKEFVSASIDRARHTQKSVLVIGGSQGAKTLNQFVVNNLSKFIAKKITFNEIKNIYGDTSPGKLVSALTQAADILHPQLKEFGGPRPVIVPVGADQLPHINFTRDIASRMESEFNFILPSARLLFNLI